LLHHSPQRIQSPTCGNQRVLIEIVAIAAQRCHLNDFIIEASKQSWQGLL
jgi:hypothetical protein